MYDHFASVRIHASDAVLDAVSAGLAEALSIPDSGDESWAGNLPVLDGIRPGRVPCRVSGHERKTGWINVELESEGPAPVEIVAGFAARRGDCRVETFACDASDKCSTDAAGDWACVLFRGRLADPRTVPAWKSVWAKDDLAAEMAAYLGMDADAGFDALAAAFQEACPVLVAEFAHAA